MKSKRRGIEIRIAEARDAAAMSTLLGELGFPSPAAVISERLEALNVAEEKTLVATRRGNVVGLLTLHITPLLHRPTSIGRLTALVVAEHERGKGIGRALVDAAEQFFAERGCKLVEVTSNLRLVDTHSFYERLGYEATSLRFKNPSRGLTLRSSRRQRLRCNFLRMLRVLSATDLVLVRPE